MANFYVSGSTSATHVKLFISYALNHVTTATVKDVFDSVFNNEVIQIEELERKDRDTGKPFKLFWITLEPARHSPVWRFVDEIEKFDKASIIYESYKGKDFYWQVRLNKEKEAPKVKTMPRIMAREETTSANATAKERADVIAFSKTKAFSKLVDSVVFEGVIEPKMEPGEIKKGNSVQRRKAERAKLQGVKERAEAMKANDASMEAKAKERMPRAAAAGMTVEKYMWLLEDEKRERTALMEETPYGKRQRLEKQEEALTEWEQREEREHDAFIFGDEEALMAM